MNYFEHHIGDYDKNTSHLTACEDGIYCRLIRRYYDKERALDCDVKEIKRVVRARTREEKAAVDSVLHEFFRLEHDGWHHTKCDEVLAVFLAGEPEREAKKKNEDTRLARHRQERAELFSIINAAGMHMLWNAPIGELRLLAERIKSGTATPPETHSGRSPATPPATATATPATATQSPIPTSQTPDTSPQPPENETSVGRSVLPAAAAPVAKAARGERLPKDWLLPKAWGEWALAKYPHWTAEIVRSIASKFRNHWVAKSGKDATKLDWQATWENWVDSGITQRDHPAPAGSANTAARDAEARQYLGFSPPTAGLQGTTEDFVDG